MTWVDRIGDYRVEKKEGPRSGGQPYIPLSAPKALVLHTTEGDTVDGAVATLRANYSASHFVVGQDRVVQMRPLTAQAATLRDNGGPFRPNSIGWQIECVGRSKQSLHSLTLATWKPLVAVARFIHERFNVPLARPTGWRDDGSDIRDIWASNNTRRESRKAVGFRGFLGHIDIPDQSPSWHWDPGALNYAGLFKAIDTGGDIVSLDRYIAGEKACRTKFRDTGADPGRAPSDKDQYFQDGWTSARAAILYPKGGTASAGAHKHTAAEVPHVHSEGKTGPAVTA